MCRKPAVNVAGGQSEAMTDPFLDGSSGSSTGAGIRMFAQGLNPGPVWTMLVDNNQIDEVGGPGIHLEMGPSSPFVTAAVTITNNTVENFDSSGFGFGLAAILTTADGSNVSLCAKISGNTAEGNNGLAYNFGGGDYHAFEDGGATFTLEGTNANYKAEILATNFNIVNPFIVNETNSALTPARHLSRKLGFVQKPPPRPLRSD